MWSLACAFIANNTGDGDSGTTAGDSPSVLVCSSDNLGFDWSHNIPICPDNSFPGGTLDPIGCQFSKASPSLASFNGKLWVAFIASNGGNNILICNSSDGVVWSDDLDIHQASNGSGPSLAVFDNKLWVAFIANNSGNNVLVCSSPDGKSWDGKNTDIHQASNGSAPSLAVFDNKLWVAFIANNSGNNVLVSSSPDGKSWDGKNTDIGQASNGSSPSLAQFYGQLWVAFIANNSGNNVLVCSSPDGKNWSNNTDIHQASNGSAPSLAPQGLYDGQSGSGGYLFVAFIANNSGNNILLCHNDGPGTTWSPTNVDIGQASGAAPSLAMFDKFTFVPASYGSASPPAQVIYYKNGKIYGRGFVGNLPCSVTITSGAGFLPAGPWTGNIDYPGIPIESPCIGTPGEGFDVQATNSAGQSATLHIKC
jgi:putative hemolysin